MAELIINGKKREYAERELPATLTDLLMELDLSDISVIAEIDGSIIRKDSFKTTNLHNGMKIELVKFVGGG